MRQNKTKQLLEYWMALFTECNGFRPVSDKPVWPDRSHVQPAQCRSLLGDMFILEVHGETSHYRLAGTKLCSLYGRELKRETFSAVFDPHDQRSAENWVSRLSTDGHLVLICSIALTTGAERINLETLLLPLSNCGGTGTRVLGSTIPHDLSTCPPRSPIISQSICSARVLRPWQDKMFERDDAFKLKAPDKADDFRADIFRHLGHNAPSIIPQGNAFTKTSGYQDETHSHQKIKHLLVIEGGKGKD